MPNFWTKFKNNNNIIVGLSPMDGITNAVFRLVVAKCGKPDILVTEFVNIDGIYFSREDCFTEFLYHEMERPIIAQVFGKDPELFYLASQIVAELGFDGFDINMGCPSKNVSSRGAGAGLIKTPELAQQIVLSSKQGISDWVESGLSPKTSVRALRKLKRTKEVLAELGVKLPDYNLKENRQAIPVSVKTRIGFLVNEIETWIPKLIQVKPAAIALHGRTFKQLYSGKADWEAIGRAAELIAQYNINNINEDPILILGNGDVGSREQALAQANKYKLDGILIGRASWGDPWVFLPAEDKPAEQDWSKKIPMIMEHTRIHQKIFPLHFFSMRKHLAWYFKGFDGASELRERLVRSNSPEEVAQIISTTKSLTR